MRIVKIPISVDTMRSILDPLLREKGVRVSLLTPEGNHVNFDVSPQAISNSGELLKGLNGGVEE